MKIKILLFITIWSIHINAQDVNNLAPNGYSIIPPAPDVTALLKYTEIPLNYFSGLSEINLPIYEIKEGSLTVPISLSYHGGGIKVDDKASSVGLGWTLMAGGCISRTVYGHPDDFYDAPANGKYNSVNGKMNGVDQNNYFESLG